MAEYPNGEQIDPLVDERRFSRKDLVAQLLTYWKSEEAERSANVLMAVQSMLERNMGRLCSGLFFGSSVSAHRDSYSDVDVMYFFQGTLPEKLVRKSQYEKEGYRTISQSDRERSEMTTEGGFSEDLFVYDGVIYHVDFRKQESLERSIQKTLRGDTSSFPLLHCTQTGRMIGRMEGLKEEERRVLSYIPDLAKERFLANSERAMKAGIQSIVKSIIRQDSLRCVDLFLKVVYAYIDAEGVRSNLYPGKKKDLHAFLLQVPNGDWIYKKSCAILQSAILDPEKSLELLRNLTLKEKKSDGALSDEGI